MTWQMIHSRRVAREFKDLCARADSEGRLKSVLTNMEHISLQLAKDPLSVGEPHNRLKHMDLLLSVVTVEKLVVRFAVDEKRHRVYLRSIALLP